MSAPGISDPAIKGWCPGAYRPMMSGDGLVVRIRPRLARLTAQQTLALCAAAQRFGNGTIDLTNRANLQLRGVTEAGFNELLVELETADLLDSDPESEARRNILVTPFYENGDQTTRLYAALTDRLMELPELPAKFGFAIDTGPARLLADCSADIRLETGQNGLILRADGAPGGMPVTEDTAIGHLITLARWFASHRGSERRMGKLLSHSEPSQTGNDTRPAPVASRPVPGQTAKGMILGAPFGQLDAVALARLITESGAVAMRVTPWRMFLLEGSKHINDSAFCSQPDDPLLKVDACPGAPYCPQAAVETRFIARSLAPHVKGSLHVSGCAKGCARNRPANVTLVGNDGRFDLVKDGRAGDEPVTCGLSETELMKLAKELA